MKAWEDFCGRDREVTVQGGVMLLYYVSNPLPARSPGGVNAVCWKGTGRGWGKGEGARGKGRVSLCCMKEQERERKE